MPFRTIGLVSTSLVGVASMIGQAAETAGNGGAFGIAAIIAASCTGGATLIGSIITGIVKLRQSKHSRKRHLSRAELLRRKAELDAELEKLEKP